MPSAAQARAERLMEAWRVLLTDRETAKRWNDVRRIEALGTVLKILDVCIAIETDEFAERDDFGNLIANPDRQLMTRLREIAAIRDIFAAERKPSDGAAESTA